MKIEIICERCHETFLVNSSHVGVAKYCITCRPLHKKEYNQKFQEEHKELFSQWAKEYRQRNPKKVGVRTFVCEFCGQEFSSPKKRKYCPESCAELARVSRQKELQKTEEYKEKGRQASREFAREHKEEISEKRKKKYYENIEEERAKALQAYWDNVENRREAQNAYKRNNRPKMRVLEQNRRAREKGAEGSYTPEQWKLLCDLLSNQCFDCGRQDVKLTVGHAIPLYRGGTNYIDNLIPQCGPCNSSQGAKIHPSFLGYEQG